MKYRIDLHCHSRFSADGVSEPEEMVQAAKERGLHGFAITDHNTCACVDYFLSAGLMRADGLNAKGQAIKRFTFNSVIEAEDTVVIGEMKVAKLTPGTDVSASRTFVQIDTVTKGSGL